MTILHARLFSLTHCRLSLKPSRSRRPSRYPSALRPPARPAAAGAGSGPCKKDPRSAMSPPKRPTICYESAQNQRRGEEPRELIEDHGSYYHPLDGSCGGNSILAAGESSVILTKLPLSIPIAIHLLKAEPLLPSADPYRRRRTLAGQSVACLQRLLLESRGRLAAEGQNSRRRLGAIGTGLSF